MPTFIKVRDINYYYEYILNTSSILFIEKVAIDNSVYMYTIQLNDGSQQRITIDEDQYYKLEKSLS